jgi:hypothetical protein
MSNSNSNKSPKSSPSSEGMDLKKLVQLYYNNSPFTKDIKKNQELEVRFGTKSNKSFTKNDYDNVIKKIKSLGFSSNNEQGYYMLRIQNEYLDSRTGKTNISKIRTELTGLNIIQEYCRTNNIKTLLSMQDQQYNQFVQFVNKSQAVSDDGPIKPIDFDDFHFRVSYSNEETINKNTDRIVRNTIDEWDKSKKIFRYINRVTFRHDDYPINVDISIVKNSKRENNSFRLKSAYRLDDSGVFTNPETYEIELEVDNTRIGPGTDFNSSDAIVSALNKTIKFVLMGLQGTNFPISYTEQHMVSRSYLKLLYSEKYANANSSAMKKDLDAEVENKRIYPSDFIGPSSYTLQLQNIIPVNENMNVPNIRENFVVTEKADGERHLMFISEDGKIYLINTNMNIIFTGAVTKEKKIMNSLLDGELIYHNKNGVFINLYASFDIYYLNGKDVRTFQFVPSTSKIDVQPEIDKNKEKNNDYRYMILMKTIEMMQPKSVVNLGYSSPIRIEFKKFYPFTNLMISQQQQQKQTNTVAISIFEACNIIMQKINDGIFEYNTDGLIFTHTSFGVGSNQVGRAGKLSKVTWEYSFKWKPPQYNTIDFLVTTKKNKNGEDLVTPIFEDGTNMSSVNQLTQYKTLVLRCGFDEKVHGYLNPCQDVIDDNLPDFERQGNKDNESGYKPVQFYPSNPYDPMAGLCNIILKKDDTGNEQMFSEENEVFEDNTIVEFRYDLTREGQWRWVPLRVRYDKTSEFRRGIKNYGNAYHVANSNWYSIHNPISEEMISTGQDIPDEIGGDDDVYYNRVGVNSNNQTKAMRDFHNLFVKKILIKSVANKGDSLIDFACGKGGDFSKWINAQLAFVFGIDISKDNLENKLDGACARYLNYRKKFKHIPYALFVNGNSGLNIKNGSAMMNDKAIQITKAVFGEGVKDESKLGKGVTRQFGKGTNGFSISSCQFALHYFFKDKDTLLQFLKNVAETTALNGYFIGTCYDGKLIFDLLKNVEKGNGIQINDGENKVKIWEIKKDYSDEKFPDDSNCVGYKIDVFQESINQLISEYLVNFDYLNRLMENFGFKIVSREEAKQLGLPEGNGLFSELYMIMLEEMKKNKYTGMGSEYGEANHMSAYEKKISFLNRYFVYKKIRHVNTNKVVIDDNDINNDDEVDIEVYEKEKSPDNNNIELSIKEVVPEVEPETIVLEVPKPKKTRAQPASKTTKKLKQKMVIEE